MWKHTVLFCVYTMSETTRLHRVMWSVYFPCGQDAVGTVELTYKEYELLKLLMTNAGIVTTRELILDRVWGIDFEGESRTLDMHIKTLRQKLKEEGSLIKTVRNVGYIMNGEKA